MSFLDHGTKLKDPEGEPLAPNLEAQNREEKNSVAVSAMIFAVGTLLSRVLGLLRDMMTARYFPVEVRDAFVVAFRLPNLFRRLLGEGSLSVSFIPVFVEIISGRNSSKTETEQRARTLIAGIFTILLTITITISLLATIFMPEICAFLLSGDEYRAVPGKFELTVRLARIMFSFLILISMYAFFMAILNSLKKFAMTALAPAFFNIALIAAALISPRLAAPELVLAWAVIIGGVLQMAVLIPGVLKAGYLPRLTTHWNSPDVLRVLKAVLPSMFGMSILQLTPIVNLYFASYLPQGAHSYLYFADRILELPLSLFVVSIGSALLPTLAKNWAEGNREAMGDTINHYIRLILFVSLPAALGMFVLAQPIVEVLFLGREFKYVDAIATAQVIQVYSFSVIVSGGVRILAQGFYAIRNTWYPAVAATVALLSHVIFAFALTRSFGLNGLAAASVLSATVNMVMLAIAYNAWVGSLQPLRLLKSFAKFAICGAVMVGVLQFYDELLRALSGRYFTKTFVLLLMITIGAAVYMLSAHILRIPEYRETVATFGGKIQRKLSRLKKK